MVTSTIGYKSGTLSPGHLPSPLGRGEAEARRRRAPLCSLLSQAIEVVAVVWPSPALAAGHGGGPTTRRQRRAPPRGPGPARGGGPHDFRGVAELKNKVEMIPMATRDRRGGGKQHG